MPGVSKMSTGAKASFSALFLTMFCTTRIDGWPLMWPFMPGMVLLLLCFGWVFDLPEEGGCPPDWFL